MSNPVVISSLYASTHTDWYPKAVAKGASTRNYPGGEDLATGAVCVRAALGKRSESSVLAIDSSVRPQGFCEGGDLPEGLVVWRRKKSLNVAK